MMSGLKTWLRRHFWTVNLGLTAVLSVLAGLVITNLLSGYLLVKPDKPDTAARPRRARKPAKPVGPRLYKNRFTVASRNIFCSTCEPDKGEEKGVASASDAVLLATYISDDPNWSFAAVRVSQPDRILMIGEGRKLGDADVVKIESKRVSLRRKGRLEYLELLKGQASKERDKGRPKHALRGPRSQYDKGIKKTGPNSYEVERRLVNEFLSNAAMAGQGARIVPNVRDGKPNGFRLYAVRPNSVYYKLGIRNGDVIHSVNNQDITSPDKALELFTKLRGASHLSISITRRGKPVTMDYTIR